MVNSEGILTDPTPESTIPSPLKGGQQWGRRTYNQSRGHEFDEPGGSAYGTQHPIDKALGRARRFKTYAADAKGARSTASDVLHQTSAVMRAGSEPRNGEMMM